MERKVGDEFFSGFYGKSYKVFSAKEKDSCIGCHFRTGTNKCQGVLQETGECGSRYRSDGSSVIFKLVWREKKE